MCAAENRRNGWEGVRVVPAEKRALHSDPQIARMLERDEAETRFYRKNADRAVAISDRILELEEEARRSRHPSHAFASVRTIRDNDDRFYVPSDEDMKASARYVGRLLAERDELLSELRSLALRKPPSPGEIWVDIE